FPLPLSETLRRTSSASHGHFPENVGETRRQIRSSNGFVWALCYQGPNTNSLLLVPTYTLPLITVGTAHFAPAPRLPLRYNSLLTSVASNACNAEVVFEYSTAHTIPLLDPLDETTGCAPGKPNT